MIWNDSEADLRLAAEQLRQGKLVAIPTETVYGLGANALDEKAVASIFRAKGRPTDNPLIVHIADVNDLKTYAEPNEWAYLLAERFWPGPLTMVLPARDCVPKRFGCPSFSCPSGGSSVDPVFRVSHRSSLCKYFGKAQRNDGRTRFARF